MRATVFAADLQMRGLCVYSVRHSALGGLAATVLEVEDLEVSGAALVELHMEVAHLDPFSPHQSLTSPPCLRLEDWSEDRFDR